MEEFNKILIGVQSGMGNAIEMIPMLNCLKKHYHHSQIYLWCSPPAYEILVNHPSSYLASMNKSEIEAHKPYDLGILPQWNSSEHLPFIQKVSHRSLFYPVSSWASNSESEVNMTLLEEIGIKASIKDYPATVHISKSDKVMAEELGTENKIILHLGCLNSSMWTTRLWPINHWAELISMLQKAGIEPMILIGPDEGGLTNDLLKLIQQPYRIFWHASIKVIAWSLKLCRCLVSIDSGIMHIGAIQGIDQIAIFGPTSEIKSKPMNDKCRIMRADIECKQCYITNKTRFASCKNNLCMQRVLPEHVFAELNKIL